MQDQQPPCLYQIFDPEAMRLEAEYFNTRFDPHFQAWVCPCDEWIDSEEGGIGDGGTCRHTQYLQSQHLESIARRA